MAAPFDRSSSSNSNASLSATFGANGRVGAEGERTYGRKLHNFARNVANTYDTPELYSIHHSLNIPRSHTDRNAFLGDVDFAVASGDRLVLVDVKIWKRGLYWSLAMPPRGVIQALESPAPGKVSRWTRDRLLGKTVGFRGFGSHQPGKWFLSQNMAIAVERYRERLEHHGVSVSAMTVFLPSATGGLHSVRFLLWPGRIRSYLVAPSFSEIEKRLGRPQPPTYPLRELLTQMARHRTDG